MTADSDVRRDSLQVLRERMTSEPEVVVALLAEVQALIREGDIESASLLLRDLGRDIGNELLYSLRLIKSGETGQAHLPTGAALYRCVDVSVLGELNGDDLAVGRLYVGHQDKDGWLRVADASGERYLYPLDCFERVGG